MWGEARTARFEDHGPFASLGATLGSWRWPDRRAVGVAQRERKGRGWQIGRCGNNPTEWSAGGRCCCSGRRGVLPVRFPSGRPALENDNARSEAAAHRHTRTTTVTTNETRTRARARDCSAHFPRVVCVWVRARANDTDPPPGGARNDPRRFSRRARSPATSSPLRSSRAAGRASCGAGTPHSRRAPPSSTAAGARGAGEPRRRPTRSR